MASINGSIEVWVYLFPKGCLGIISLSRITPLLGQLFELLGSFFFLASVDCVTVCIRCELALWCSVGSNGRPDYDLNNVNHKVGSKGFHAILKGLGIL